eukprot:894457-Prorocentrum_minimum.AAC.4
MATIAAVNNWNSEHQPLRVQNQWLPYPPKASESPQTNTVSPNCVSHSISKSTCAFSACHINAAEPGLSSGTTCRQSWSHPPVRTRM